MSRGQVFLNLWKLWKTARIGAVAKEVADITDLYDRLNGIERYELASGFEYTKLDLERLHGTFRTWHNKNRISVAKRLMKDARRERDEWPCGANGVALLSLLLEAQTLPGQQAARIVRKIEQWHEDAVVVDVSARSENAVNSSAQIGRA